MEFHEYFSLAREDFAVYMGTLANVIRKLEADSTADTEELAAYKAEIDRLAIEYKELSPTNVALINKARYIYNRISRSIMDKYLCKC